MYFGEYMVVRDNQSSAVQMLNSGTATVCTYTAIKQTWKKNTYKILVTTGHMYNLQSVQAGNPAVTLSDSYAGTTSTHAVSHVSIQQCIHSWQA